MRRPFRNTKPELADTEGIEKAKSELEMAQLIERHSAESARVHEDILRRNNLAAKFHKALGGA